MARYFYRDKAGSRRGPVDFDQIQELVSSKEIIPSTELIGETTNQIMVAEAVPGIEWPAPVKQEPGEPEPVALLTGPSKPERDWPYWGDILVAVLQVGFAFGGLFKLIAVSDTLNFYFAEAWSNFPVNVLSLAQFSYVNLGLEVLAGVFTATGKRWALWTTFVFFCVKIAYLIHYRQAPFELYAWEIPVPCYCLVRLYLSHFGI